ncbi:DUF2057 domain-containing protein [Shewanella sp. JNE10-2]|uniref:YccT family protein n=1 Tax=unclassified Shewanella TaxID=196818 RepID=UPI0020041515|nr:MULTISPECIES: DUF2057 domain-containing protein [unclassified Shewanella]MCK7631945.1 DUF2057 domain-containing protein [Shewanella sp. JNE9-1]MCK7636238.1 DUF2057 domain-containing protein [Shewanella sp. JNE17]MCK7647131.1 DUF2057 domain-containing protein [Shewanella sp. JNE3-1]MCK7651423.1 DUF2057 domain-containing protein [Shewanella sp. JNE8]MCK7655248.1 DUF2057 domain-containing protein [Shewanella sp. JNE4-1]
MKYQSILCATALILTTVQPATAEITLNLPKNAEVLTVNGRPAVKSDSLILADGINQIAFRYSVQYRQQAETVRYQSDVLIVRFDASTQILTLRLPAINSARDTKKFDESPKLALLNAQDEAVSFTSDILVKHGIQLGRDFEHEILQYNLSNQPASLNLTMNTETTIPNNAIAVSSTTAISANQPPVHQAPAVKSTSLIAIESTISTSNDQSSQTTSATTPSQAEISQMLDYWYKQANEDTKASFKAKINQR